MAKKTAAMRDIRFRNAGAFEQISYAEDVLAYVNGQNRQRSICFTYNDRTLQDYYAYI